MAATDAMTITTFYPGIALSARRGTGLRCCDFYEDKILSCAAV